MNGPTIMYGPGISAARMPTDQQVRQVLNDFTRATENALLTDIKKQLAEVLERLSALERKSKRGRRRK